MLEGDTTETVGVLMEATTNRLVLVSTPDDGDHVRFDIRPLQEFFASEFLYEAVSASTLHSRLELVAGDSHWSEVMHFLVSALMKTVVLLNYLWQFQSCSDWTKVAVTLTRDYLLVDWREVHCLHLDYCERAF